MSDTTPEHLAVTTSDRGFQYLPALPGARGGSVEVYESSAADGPHVWLKATETPLHLSAETAVKLAEQLVMLVQSHYQGPIDVAQLLQVDISLDEAAVILNSSTERVIELLTAEAFGYIGRRVVLSSLLEHKRLVDAKRAEAADELTILAQDDQQ
jgi:hypothetical protein